MGPVRPSENIKCDVDQVINTMSEGKGGHKIFCALEILLLILGSDLLLLSGP